MSGIPIEELGIVGCGGAGFPSHVKFAAKNVEHLIVNGAECEPLLHKDKEILLNETKDFLAGLGKALDLTGAKTGHIGVKKKYAKLIHHLESAVTDPRVRLLPLGDFYPAGDEYELVFEATGRLIPFGGIPLHIGCVVTNVETLLNLGRGRPMISKILTVTGAVPHPVTIEVPIGITMGEAFALAGLTGFSGLSVIDGGPMMGRLVRDPATEVVTKTCGGLIAFPSDHPLIRKMTRSSEGNSRIARSACDQCTDCSELCPRALLGYPIRPHKAMRTAQLAPHDDRNYAIDSVFCSECGLCSLFSCPEDLPPREISVMAKKRHLGAGVKLTDWKGAPTTHPLRNQRRVSIERLLKRLGLLDFDRKAPLTPVQIRPERVRLPLKMHLGVPSQPLVKQGDRVQAGQKIAAIPAGKLGAALHASIAGNVEGVTPEAVTIVKG